MPNIRAIFFDAVGTLLHPQPPFVDVYFEVGRRFGSLLSRFDIEARFVQAFAAQEKIDADAGQRTDEARELRRWQDIVAAVFDDVAEPAACFAALYEHFGRPDAWRCDPEDDALLDHFQARGYVVGLASNFDGRLRSVAAGFTSLRKVSHLIISSEVGWKKPAAQFFEAVCRSVDLPPAAILFVGDDLLNDYQGARAAGFEAVLLDPGGRAVGGAVQRVAQLGEVANWLGGAPAPRVSSKRG